MPSKYIDPEVFRDRKVVIVLPQISNFQYFDYLEELCPQILLTAQELTILDCDWAIFKQKESRRAMRICHKRRMALLGMFAYESKCKHIKIGRESFIPRPLQGVISFNRLDEIDITLSNSIKSQFLTRGIPIDDEFIKANRYQRMILGWHSDYMLSLGIADHWITEDAANLVIFFNGRWPSQAAIRVHCERTKTEFLSFEHGRPRGARYHLNSFQTQEHTKMRNFFAAEIASSEFPNDSFVAKWSLDWLKKQSSDVNQNQFLSTKLNASYNSLSSEKPIAIVFNSSIDERFSNLGVEMNGWESQPQAITQVVSALKDSGFHCVVKIHPNTGNKSWHELAGLVKPLISGGIDFVLPWDQISTYELLKYAQIVVTWGSTVSLEATAMGIPTFNLGRTQFDNLIDVQLICPRNVREIKNKIVTPDPLKTYRAIYLTQNWGYSLANTSNASETKQNSYASGHDLLRKYIMRFRLVLKFIIYFPRFLNSKPLESLEFFRLLLGYTLGRKLMKLILYRIIIRHS